jgi:F0F1-type ATP synthase membrane subunit a
MKRVFNWVSGMLKDEKGSPSSKRVLGVVCAITLCVTMYQNAFSAEHIAPATSLVNAVAALAFGLLGLTSVDKFSKKKDENGND